MSSDLGALCARYHDAYNQRDFDVWREVFAEDCELVIDGMTFRGLDAAVAYGSIASAQFPNLYIGDERIVAVGGDTVVTEIHMVSRDRGDGPTVRQGTSCEILRVRDGRIVSARSYYMAEAPQAEEAVRVPTRGEAARMAEERAALRRVATLVARGGSEDEVFELVNREVGGLVGGDITSLLRFDPGGTVTLVGGWSASGIELPIGASRPVDPNVAALRDSGRAMRWGTGGLPIAGPFAEEGAALGVRAAVGVPIVVEGEVWGVSFTASTTEGPLAVDAEERIAGFMELVATAISNAQARAEVRLLVAEQAARERVATLVAQDVEPPVLFNAVTTEVGRLLGADLSGMIRYVDEETIEPVATWDPGGAHPDVGGRWPLDGNTLATTIKRTMGPARQDRWEDVPGPVAQVIRDVLGVTSSVGSPIVVDGETWGGLFVHGKRPDDVLPADTEERLESFCELVSTAISNAEARAAARRLAEEQAALRRVATLVARESPPQEVLTAVAEEVGRVLQVEDTRIIRYDDDGMVTVMADWGRLSDEIPIGLRVAVGGENVSSMVARTGRSARKDYYDDPSGPIGERVRQAGIRSAVGAPITVGGRLWGAVIAAALTVERLPQDAEGRIAEFAELLATAISNVEARADLAASRARLVAASDDERRRVVRDLHDGAQQRLVHTVITLARAREELAAGRSAEAVELVEEALGHAQRATTELRELAHGIMPATLTRGGLRAAVEALASRAPVAIEIDVPDDRLPAPVEATAYFVVAEALTNVAKHARASRASVLARVGGDRLRVEVRDDGVGGARVDGSGVVGLADRLAVLDGRLEIESADGDGTLVAAEIPITGEER